MSESRRVHVADTEAGERMALLERLGSLDGVALSSGSRFSTDAASLRAEIGDAEVVCIAISHVTADVLDAASSLRLVVKCGIGTDTIDLAAAEAHGIGVVRTTGVNFSGPAEYVLAAALLHFRRLTELDRAVRADEWGDARLEWAGRIGALPGKALGIVGLGAIGREVARLAGAHGMTVLAHDSHVAPDAADAAGARLLPLEELLERADVVSLHVVLDESTRHLIGPRELERMKPSALLVNAARGAVVDTAALAQALRKRTIAAAVVDVLEQEPPTQDNPLLALENCTVTPHLAGCTDHGYDEIGSLAAKLVRGFLAGEELPKQCVVVPLGERRRASSSA